MSFFSFYKKVIIELLTARPTLKTITINSGWLIGDKLVRLFIGLFMSAWLARYLGPDQYGRLAYVIAFLAVFQAFSMLGLDSIIVRNIAQNPEDSNRILGTAFILKLTASIFSILTASISMAFFYPENDELLSLVILISVGFIFQTADIVDLWFQSKSQSRRTVIAKFISYILSAIFKISLIVANAPLWLFAVAIGGETILSATALYFAYKNYPTLKKWIWDFNAAKKMMHQSFPFLLSGMSIIIYMKSSQIIINEMAGSVAVGIYSTAQMLSELWYFLPMTLVVSFGPVIARKKIQSEAVYQNALINIFGIMWVASILISTLISLSSTFIVLTLFGEAYRASALILSIHVFTLIPVCIGVMQSLWLINENKSLLALYQALAGAVSSVGLNLILVSKYGIIGAAIATVISQFIQAFLVIAILSPQLLYLQVKSLYLVAEKARNFKSYLPK